MKESEAADQAYKKTLGRAGRLLVRRVYSKAALVARLIAEGCDQATAERAVASLAQVGYLDESRDIESLIGDGIRRGYGSLRIRAHLEAAGYSGETIERALDRFLPPNSEVAAAIEWLKSKFRRTGKRDPARAFASLARRGYPEDVARDAVEREFGSEQ